MLSKRLRESSYIHVAISCVRFITNVKLFKNEYRRALDSMTHLSVNEVQMLVGEENVAFVLNHEAFQGT